MSDNNIKKQYTIFNTITLTFCPLPTQFRKNYCHNTGENIKPIYKIHSILNGLSHHVFIFILNNKNTWIVKCIHTRPAAEATRGLSHAIFNCTHLSR